MKLIFSDNYFVYILAYIMLPVLSVVGIRMYKRNNSAEEYLSEQVTDSIKGIFILVIVLHHISVRLVNVGAMRPYTFAGYLAVGIFYFISGYSLLTSYMRKNDYLNGFLIKRLKRVYIPFLLIYMFYIFLLYFVLGEKFSFSYIMKDLITVTFPGYTLWYLKVQILFYILFYILFKKFNSRNAIIFTFMFSLIYILVCNFLGADSFWYNTSFCFPVGLTFALYKEKITNLIIKRYPLMLGSFAIAFFGSFLISNMIIVNIKAVQVPINVVSSALFTIMILIIIMQVKLSSKIMQFIGKISMEIYLVHLALLEVYFNIVKINSSISILGYILITICISFIFNKLLNFYFIKVDNFKYAVSKINTIVK